MRSVWLVRSLHLPLLLVIVMTVASMHRAPPGRTVPLTPRGTVWHWSDRSIRVERWHSPVVVRGPVTGRGEVWGGEEFLNWDRDLFGITAAQANGTSTFQTYDFLEFRTWRAIPPALALSFVAGLLDIFGRERRRRVRGVCPGCGYDLRATPDRCPECGRPCA